MSSLFWFDLFLYPLKLWKGSLCIGWMWFFLFWFDLFYILWNCEKARFELVGCEFFIWLELPRCTWSQAHSIILKEKYFQEEKCDQQQDHKMITSPLNYLKKKIENFQEEKCENILTMIRYGIDGQYMANLVSWWRSQPSHCIDFKTFIKNFLGQVQEKIVFFPQLFCLFTVKHSELFSEIEFWKVFFNGIHCTDKSKRK